MREIVYAKFEHVSMTFGMSYHWQFIIHHLNATDGLKYYNFDQLQLNLSKMSLCETYMNDHFFFGNFFCKIIQNPLS